MVARGNRKIEIPIRPVQVMGARQLDIDKLSNRHKNQGKSSNGRNFSVSSMSNQKPCCETFVTSTAGVCFPRSPDFIFMLLDSSKGSVVISAHLLDIFIYLRPANAYSIADELPVRTLLRRRIEQARKPLQWCRDLSAIRQYHAQRIFGKADIPR